MFSEKFTINSLDVDQNLELRLPNLFKYMQIVASKHVESVGAGHRDLMSNNYLWVVIRNEVKIFRTPTLDETITVTTHPGQTRSFIFPRYFQIYDEKGNLIISVSGIWAIIDKDTRRVVLKTPYSDKVIAESDPNDFPLPEKVVGEASSLVDNRKVRYSDIDINGHMNNTEYIEFLMDTHGPEFYKTHRVKRININFDKEIKYKEEVQLFTNRNELLEVIKGKVNDENRFTAEIEYEIR